MVALPSARLTAARHFLRSPFTTAHIGSASPKQERPYIYLPAVYGIVPAQVGLFYLSNVPSTLTSALPAQLWWHSLGSQVNCYCTPNP